jgi:chromosome segregation ATPase
MSEQATGATDPGQQQPAATAAQPEQAQQQQAATAAQPEKTFTQAELDTIIGERLTRERAKLPSEEDQKAFQTWKDGQKTEAEKQAGVLRELETLKAEKTDLELQTAILMAGVPANMVKYAMLDVKDAATTAEGIKTFMEGEFFKSQPASQAVKFGVEGQKTAQTTADDEKNKALAAAYAAMGVAPPK